MTVAEHVREMNLRMATQHQMQAAAHWSLAHEFAEYFTSTDDLKESACHHYKAARIYMGVE